jgi:HK97 gp10 family phage protein
VASSIGVDVDISQLNSLKVSLNIAKGGVGTHAANAVRKTAFDIEADAKVFAPYEFGDLRNSISTEFFGDGRFSSFSAEIGPTVDYGIYQEFGTDRMAPQAFLGPAFDRRIPDLISALSDMRILGNVSAVGGRVL